MAHLCNPINKVAPKKHPTQMSESEFEKGSLRQVRLGLSCGDLIGVVRLARVAMGLRPPSQRPNGGNY